MHLAVSPRRVTFGESRRKRRIRIGRDTGLHAAGGVTKGSSRVSRHLNEEEMQNEIERLKSALLETLPLLEPTAPDAKSLSAGSARRRADRGRPYECRENPASS